LLLPAVQAARDAARRSQCKNNLKQMGLGLHNFHDVRKQFPPGNITDGNCCGTQSHGNWAIYILPYMEQEALFSQYNDTGGLDYPFSHTPDVFNTDVLNQAVCSKNVDFYTCPSDLNKGRVDLAPESGPGSGFNAVLSDRLVSRRGRPSWHHQPGQLRFQRGKQPGVGRYAPFPAQLARTLAHSLPLHRQRPVPGAGRATETGIDGNDP
jgi:hypothetical protein